MKKKRLSKAVRAHAAFADGLVNQPLRVGVGSTTQASHYVPTFTSFSRQQLEWSYQSSWICALMIDLLAVDMTREGIDVHCDDPERADRIERVMQRYRVWPRLSEAIKWSRLFGGSVAVLLIDGEDMSTPLREVRRKSFRGLYVLDRWQVVPSVERVQTLGPAFGDPEYYELVSTDTGIEIPGGKIHHSRVIRFEGRRLPYYCRQAYQGWGGSILDPVYDRVQAFDLATESASQLISKAYLRYYKVKGLREILTNDLARKGFMAQMEHIRQFQSSEGMTVGDVEDEFQVFNYTFTGLPELLVQFGQQISGACGIPLVRLFGQSPAGMNATGESDFRNYYDNVKHQQELHLRPGIEKLLSVIWQSEFGEQAPVDLDFEFIGLWQLTSEQKAQAAQSEAGAIVQALGAGAISTSVAMKELKALSGTLGIFASITDDDIAEAEEQDNGMMPPMPGVMNEEQSIPGSDKDQEPAHVVQEATPRDSEVRGSDCAGVQRGD